MFLCLLSLSPQTFVCRTFSDVSVLRCADSLGDFMGGYLPLHQLQEEGWRLLPLLLWLEASIYALDEANEAAIQQKTQPQCDETTGWKLIRAELTKAELLPDVRIEAELAEGARYWRLERVLCNTEHPKEAEIERCARGKSFDYRLMHLVALKQTKFRKLFFFFFFFV